MRFFITKKESYLSGGLRVTKGGIMITHKGEAYYCNKFPKNYKGTNPLLEVYYYDSLHESWEKDLCKDAMTKAMYKKWLEIGKPKADKSIHNECERLYKRVPHDTKIGHIQSPDYSDPNKTAWSDQTVTDYECVKPSVYKYYQYIGAYGSKDGTVM